MTMRPSGQLLDGVLDAAGAAADGVDEAGEGADDGADDLALGVGLGRAGEAGRGGPETREQLGEAGGTVRDVEPGGDAATFVDEAGAVASSACGAGTAPERCRRRVVRTGVGAGALRQPGASGGTRPGPRFPGVF